MTGVQTCALPISETASAEAATAPAHSAVASTVVPEIEGSHKDYLTIFSQIKGYLVFKSKSHYYNSNQEIF